MSFWEFESEEVKVVVSDIELMFDVVEHLWTTDGIHLDVVIPEEEARDIRLNFPLNARISELIAREDLHIHATETTPLSTIILDGSQVYTFPQLGQTEQFAKVTDDELHTRIDEEFSRITESAEIVDPDILAWGRLLDRLAEIVGNETRLEFERLIKAARIEKVGALDDISVAIVAAAHGEALLNDLSTWAGEVGLASAATFSRRKQKLEDDGIIYTEKVPIEVGRPKQRLKLTNAVDEVEVRGEELDITRDGRQSTSDAGDDTDTGSDSATNRFEPSDVAHGDEDLQLLEQELKEAIQSR